MSKDSLIFSASSCQILMPLLPETSKVSMSRNFRIHSHLFAQRIKLVRLVPAANFEVEVTRQVLQCSPHQATAVEVQWGLEEFRRRVLVVLGVVRNPEVLQARVHKLLSELVAKCVVAHDESCLLRHRFLQLPLALPLLLESREALLHRFVAAVGSTPNTCTRKNPTIQHF